MPQLKKALGELCFVLSYGLFLVYFFQFKRELIFDGDALHAAVILQWVGHALGASLLGGVRLVNWLENHPGPRTMGTAFGIWAGFWGLVAVLRHHSFVANDLDLGIHTQTLWNLAHGNGFANQMTLSDMGSYLNDHQSFSLVLFAPFYWTPWGTELLLFTQALLFYLPALLLGLWVSKNKSPIWGWAVFFTWILWSPLARNTLWDWHENALSVPALTLLAWAFFQRRALWFWISLVVLLLTKEHFWVVLAPVAALFTARTLWSRSRVVALGAAIPILAVMFFGFTFLQSEYGSGVNFVRYTHIGANPKEMILNVLSHPKILWDLLTDPDRLGFLHAISSSLGYTNFLGGWGTLAWLPLFLIHALSQHTPQYAAHYHYITEIWPLAFVAALSFAWRWPQKRWALLAITLAFWCSPSSPWLTSLEFIDGSQRCTDFTEELQHQVEKARAACGESSTLLASGASIPHLVDQGPMHSFWMFDLPKMPKRLETFALRSKQSRCSILVLSQAETQFALSYLHLQNQAYLPESQIKNQLLVPDPNRCLREPLQLTVLTNIPAAP